MKAALVSQGSKSSKMLAEAMSKYFEEVDELPIKNIEVHLTSKKLEVLYNGNPMGDYDCMYVKGSYKYADLLRAITLARCNETYMPVKASAFSIGHDKMLTQLKLQKEIPMPKTYLSSGSASAKKVLESINYPIIMKIPKGTQGKGVMYADSFAAASSMLDTLTVLRQPFLIQEFIETGGVDTRVIVVGDKVAASMKRKAVEGEERSNIHAGGMGEPCLIDAHTKKIAIESSKMIGAEICAVDILEGPTGPMVIEVNLSPGLQGITSVTKIDVADTIAKFLYTKTKEKTDSSRSTGVEKIMKEIAVEGHEILTNIDMRGNRLLLPELVTKMTKFNDKEEYCIKCERGKLVIEKSDLCNP